MPRFPEAGEQGASARRTSPALVIVGVACVALIVAYLGNAAWNLLHLRHYDASQLFAAATLPVPFVEQAVPRWVELASAAALLLLVLLTAAMLGAARRHARRDKTHPFAVADTADVFIADKTRIVPRPPPISLPVATSSSGVPEGATPGVPLSRSELDTSSEVVEP